MATRTMATPCQMRCHRLNESQDHRIMRLLTWAIAVMVTMETLKFMLISEEEDELLKVYGVG